MKLYMPPVKDGALSDIIRCDILRKLSRLSIRAAEK